MNGLMEHNQGMSNIIHKLVIEILKVRSPQIR